MASPPYRSKFSSARYDTRTGARSAGPKGSSLPGLKRQAVNRYNKRKQYGARAACPKPTPQGQARPARMVACPLRQTGVESPPLPHPAHSAQRMCSNLDGGFAYLVGNTNSYGQGQDDVLVIKADSQGGQLPPPGDPSALPGSVLCLASR